MTLTPRQREIAGLVADGRSTKGIGRVLGIAPSTVDRHIRNAAARVPLPGPPRHRLTVWILVMDDPEPTD